MVDLATIRAALFVPASRPERFGKAAAAGADAVILDLEDAVALDDKDAARSALRANFTERPVIVRINALGTRFHDADLAAVVKLRPDAVMLPKAETSAAVASVAKAIAGIPIIALVETARGLSAARQLAATPGVARLAFGSVDFCSDMGCVHLRHVLLPARMELVLASRLAGLPAPIDGVTVNVGDPTMCHGDARHAYELGMTGKLCIHPRQVEEVKRAFAPSLTEISWARRVLSSGDGAAAVDGEMVDEPVRGRARAIMAHVN